VGHFPAFNVADSAICIGAGLFILDELRRVNIITEQHHDGIDWQKNRPRPVRRRGLLQGRGTVPRLTKAGASVQVVMTEAATHFITAVTMQALSGRPCTPTSGTRASTTTWRTSTSRAMPTPSSSRRARRTSSQAGARRLRRPAVDHVRGASAHVPLLVAPAMNVEMWQNPATQRNVQQLRDDGITSSARRATRPAAKWAWAACWSRNSCWKK
jgi:hypothetical protein